MSTNATPNISTIRLNLINPTSNNGDSSSCINPPSSNATTLVQEPSRSTPTNPGDIPLETIDIFDYMIWSGINVIMGGVVLGVPSLVFSILTRKYKRKGDVKRSKKYSLITLNLNCVVSFVALIGFVYLITYFNNSY